MNMGTVSNVINDSLGNNAICIASDDNAPELVIRVRLMNDDNKDNLELLKAVMNDLPEVKKTQITEKLASD